MADPKNEGQGEAVGNPDDGGPAFINFDPDAATTYIIDPIEDILQHYNPAGDGEYKTYSFEGCYHLIPTIITGLSSRLRIPASKVATCAIDIGVNNLTLRFGSIIEDINRMRGRMLLHDGCAREDEEALAREWAVEFKTSRKKDWGVRLLDSVVSKADRLGAMSGFSLRQMRQVAIMAGVAHSPIIGGQKQKKILEILKSFGVAMEYKAVVVEKQFKEIMGKQSDEEFVDNIWEVV